MREAKESGLQVCSTQQIVKREIQKTRRKSITQPLRIDLELLAGLESPVTWHGFKRGLVRIVSPTVFGYVGKLHRTCQYVYAFECWYKCLLVFV